MNGSLTNKWSMVGGYAFQDAFITSTTTAAAAGKEVAQVPRHSFTLWNKYQLLQKLGVGLGIVNRSDMFAAIDNTIVLPVTPGRRRNLLHVQRKLAAAGKR